MKNFNIKIIYNIIFLVSIFVLLITPMTNINKSVISKKENRVLAKYEPFYYKKKKIINYQYGKHFEQWLKDRFFGRMYLMNIHNALKYTFSGRFVNLNSIIIDKNKHFMHENITSSIYDIKEQYRISRQLKEFNKYCTKRNIKLYVVVMPQKDMVYLSDLAKSNNNDKAKISIRNIGKDNEINLVFPLDEFLEHKKTSKKLLFNKTDSHTTMDGVFIGYNALMDLIQKDFPNVKRVNIADFDFSYNRKICFEEHRKYELGYTCRIAGIPDSLCNEYLDVKYTYYSHKDRKNLITKTIHTDTLNKKTFDYNKGSNLKLMVFGDSFVENLMEFLPYSFKHTARIRLNKSLRKIRKPDEQFKILKYYENEINEYKPDIIVIYICYLDSLGKLRNLTIK